MENPKFEQQPNGLEKDQLSEAEKAGVETQIDWYETQKQEHPEATEEELKNTIISGLGYSLGIPGYRMGDENNPEAKPTEEQQARLEELYRMVISTSKSESVPSAPERAETDNPHEERNEKFGEAASEVFDNASHEAEGSGEDKERLKETLVEAAIQEAFTTEKQKEVIDKCKDSDEYVGKGIAQFGQAFEFTGKAYERFKKDGGYDVIIPGSKPGDHSPRSKYETDISDRDDELTGKLIVGALRVAAWAEDIDDGKVKNISPEVIKRSIQQGGIYSEFTADRQENIEYAVKGFAIMADGIEKALKDQYEKAHEAHNEVQKIDDKISALLAKYQQPEVSKSEQI
jgi:hypothetical protein